MKRDRKIGRVLFSEGFRELNLPSDVVRAIVGDAQQQRVHGPGAFSYVPVAIQMHGTITELVVVLFDKAVKQENIQARPGDICIQLRSEWNEDENPIETAR